MGNCCGGGNIVPPEPVVDAIVATETEARGHAGQLGASATSLSSGQLNSSAQFNSSGHVNRQLDASGQYGGSRSSNTLQGQRDPSITSLVPNTGMSEMFARQMSEEEEIDLLTELKAERDRVLKEQQFLMTIREALLAIQSGQLDSDEEEEAPKPSQRTKKRNRFSLRRPRKLEKHSSFQLNSKGWRPVTDVPQSKRASVRNQMRRSIHRIPESQPKEKPQWSTTLEGEGSRAWNNPFASRLQLMRKFYDWKDIPMEFFVDRYVADMGHSPLSARPRLAARLAERRKLNARRKDNRKSIRQSLRRSSIQKTLNDVQAGLKAHEARKKAASTNRKSVGSDGYDTDQYVQAVEENYASDSSEDSSGYGII